MTVSAEIVIEEEQCKGCGYCEAFCPRGCIVVTGEKVSPQGYLLPSVVHPEWCNTCGSCVTMCPDLAITVYLNVG